MNTVGQNIEMMRKRRHMTQQDLAERIGISNRTISNWERGTRDPGSDNIQLICKILDCDIDDILQMDLSSDASTPLAKSGFVQIYDKIPFGTVINKAAILATVARSGEFFGLRINDDNMSPEIRSGDVAIVKKQESVNNGDIVIIRFNESDALCKRVVIANNMMTFLSFNPLVKPIIASTDSSIEILGRVVEIRRTL